MYPYNESFAVVCCCIIKFFGGTNTFLVAIYMLSFTISLPWYLSWQRYTGLYSVLMFALDHSVPDNHLLLVLALEKTHSVLSGLFVFGPAAFYYSVEIVNGIEEMLLGSQSFYLLCFSSSR